MLTEIIIISGFLGAGKTTFIQKLLRETWKDEKVVLIENDFGDISVDAALLKSGGIEVREINSGCICCSLSGDFIKAIQELLNRFQPDKIIIEPSGVSKLSDIIKACSDPRVLSLIKIKSKMNIVDVKRCQMYLDNFGEFFEDQIKEADTILLSRVEAFPEKIEAAQEMIKNLNPQAIIYSKPWDKISADEIFHPHFIPAHSHDCSCGHTHSAEDAFDTITIGLGKIWSAEDLKARVSMMERNAEGTILRAKGIVHGPNGYLNLQYIPGETKISDCVSKGNSISIIGHNLNKHELYAFFSEE